MKRNLAVRSAGVALVLLACAIGAAGDSQKNLTSEVRMLKQAPALYVNGKLTSQMLAAPYQPGPSDFTDFTNAGISTFDINCFSIGKHPNSMTSARSTPSWT